MKRRNTNPPVLITTPSGAMPPDRPRPEPGFVRVRLVIAFEGTAYAGWQAQATGIGVQQVVAAAIARLFPGDYRVQGSSRTDTGVHALGMVAHVDLPRRVLDMGIERLALAINAHLPPDIRIMTAARARAGFHARFHARGKQYRYLVWNHHHFNPLLRLQAWHQPRALAFAAMKEAARHFVGTHDFRSFTTHRRGVLKNPVRTLTRCEVRRQGPLFTFIIEGDGFLYRMCRALVGTIVGVGLGHFPPGAVIDMLARCDRRVAGMSAPAAGLVLWKVHYRGGPGVSPDAAEGDTEGGQGESE